ncbi:hypothetical protein L249_0489 [Ophiocordyceps polyrhachis-furcata BCC 54312]|uniref:Uncharacterized protein n=1 Tax=Ophiocordyceps polyrhachis-furcata BCC 54312 TaxID=1330021 RepID=A0A367LEW6_9HYPO|nr:hypothetical protein L249_0489 [Ophiocordyceps polyrhachis-furcata BCC 54312]
MSAWMCPESEPEKDMERDGGFIGDMFGESTDETQLEVSDMGPKSEDEIWSELLALVLNVWILSASEEEDPDEVDWASLKSSWLSGR